MTTNMHGATPGQHTSKKKAAGVSNTTPTAIYRHPDGEGLIHFDVQAMRLYITNEAHEPPTTAHAVMGPWGMRKLAMALLALADELDDAQQEAVSHDPR